MKVVVTGGTGFLGKQVCFYLAKKGYNVLAIGRNQKQGQILQQREIAFQFCDLTKLDQVERAFADAEVVVHCAALSSAWGRFEEFYECNVLGTKNVLTACHNNNVKRLIHISSPSIYSELNAKEMIRENDPLPKTFLNDYAATKWEAEKLVVAACSEKFVGIILRPQAIFGPEDPSIIPRLIRANQKSGIPFFKTSPKIDITYVENVAHACWLAIVADAKLSGRSYNITNDNPVDLIPFLNDLFQQIGLQLKLKKLPFFLALFVANSLEYIHKVFVADREPVLTKYSLSVLSKTRTLDISAAKKDLKYTPIFSIQYGVKQFVDWYKEKNK